MNETTAPRRIPLRPRIIAGLMVFAFILLAVYRNSRDTASPKGKSFDRAAQHLKFGAEALNIGQFAAAQQEFERVLRFAPMNEPAQKGLYKAELLLPLEKCDPQYEMPLLEKKIRAFVEEQPDDPHAWLGLALLRLANKSGLDQAKRHLDKAIAYDPALSLAYAVKGDIYVNEDSSEQATRMYEQAYRLSPEHRPYSIRLMERYYHQKNYAGVIRLADSLLSRDSESPEGLHFSANALRMQDQLHTALLRQEQMLRIIENSAARARNEKQEIGYCTHNDLTALAGNDSLRNVYAYYSIALTSYLVSAKYRTPGHKLMAEKYVFRAPKLSIAGEAAIKALVTIDIDRLMAKSKTAGPEQEHLLEFKNKFLNPQQRHAGAQIGNWRIQLATCRIRASALDVKNDFEARYRDLPGLAGKKPTLERVSQSGRSYYVVQLGGFSSKGDAIEVRNKLGNYGKQSLVVGPR